MSEEIDMKIMVECSECNEVKEPEEFTDSEGMMIQNEKGEFICRDCAEVEEHEDE